MSLGEKNREQREMKGLSKEQFPEGEIKEMFP